MKSGFLFCLLLVSFSKPASAWQAKMTNFVVSSAIGQNVHVPFVDDALWVNKVSPHMEVALSDPWTGILTYYDTALFSVFGYVPPLSGEYVEVNTEQCLAPYNSVSFDLTTDFEVMQPVRIEVWSNGLTQQELLFSLYPTLGYYEQHVDRWVNETWAWSVRLAAVPEPSSLLALASGVVGLGGLCWRRKR